MSDTIDYGIDLGTTTSIGSVFNGEDATVVKNNDGWDFTPSAVWIPKRDVVHVGRRARERWVRDPDNVAAEFKLEMGLAGAERSFAAAGIRRTPQQLSAEVLTALRADAAHQCGTPPASAVITVPASFALNQNVATREAAVLAGFGPNCPLVQEPTAAAFAYGFHNTSERAYWLVFDFGGGTFDAAIVSRRDGELQVLNHAGDPYLGGKLIDWAIVERILAPAAERQLGLSDFRRDDPARRVDFAMLKVAAEDAKVALSRHESIDVVVALQAAGPDGFEYTLTRGELDRIAEPFYSRAIGLCRDALTEGGLGQGDIDRVLLVGGATLAPGLRERVGDPTHGLGVPVDFSQDPITVVARGAALFAATVPFERPPAAPVPGRFAVELTYQRSVSITTPTVAGRLSSTEPVDWTAYAVTLANPGGKPPFCSPRIVPNAAGAFITDVQVEPLATSTFTIGVVDATGSPQKVDPDTLSITHREVEFGGAVLTHSLGIRMADRAFAPMLRKGTTLPARTREVFRTSQALRRNDAEAVVRIPVVEGERSRGDRNRQVGMLEIRPRDVRIDLPAGSEVEVTFEIDESRIVTVVADVPLVGEQFEAEVDLGDVRAPDADALAAVLAAAEQRLKSLRASAEATGAPDARRRLARLDEERTVETAREQVQAARVDVGAAATGEQRLRELHADLDDIEDVVALPALHRELRETVAECSDLVDRVGDSGDRKELSEVARRAEEVIAGEEPAAVRVQLERAQALCIALQRRTPDWNLRVFDYIRIRRADLRPADRAEALIREGEQAVAAGDERALGGVIQRLIRLLPVDEQDKVGGLVPR